MNRQSFFGEGPKSSIMREIGNMTTPMSKSMRVFITLSIPWPVL